MITLALRCECGHAWEVGPAGFSWLANPERTCPACNARGPYLFEGFREKPDPEEKPT